MKNELREKIMDQYEVANGRIVSPGKFEGEPVYAPAYWDHALEGFADEDTNDGFAFVLQQADFDQWPELANDGFALNDTLHLRESDQGFVYCN